MRRDEDGMIVVETVGSFVLFTFLVISILSLVNIVTLQARIHYAATQAAETVSMYSYILEVMGLAEKIVSIEERAGKVKDQANDFKGELNSMMDSMQSFRADETINHAGAAADMGMQWASDTINNPKEALSLVVNYGLSEVGHFAFGECMRLLVGRYLSNGTMNADEYLKSVNVVGGLKGLKFYDFSLFDFNDMSENDSALLNENGDVVIVVRYSIDYTFGVLPLPFTELEVTHVIKTKAWLGGSGDGYDWDK